MTKFLNESGFRRIIKTIKNALSLKADKSELPLLVTYDGSQCDTSIADIYAAFLAGRDVEMNYGYMFKLSLVQCSEEVAIFSANFSDQSIGLKGTISNGVDTWEFIVVDLQERLTSGTNIKTVAGNSLLGSGNVTLNDSDIYHSGEDGEDGNYIDDGDTVDVCLNNLDTAVASKQNTLVSGTNIKTVNNNSLLGSGNISIEPNEIASITTTESTASGGNNTVTINTTDGTSKTFNVKNGVDGADGVSLGEIALVQTTGDSEESVMSQKAVTEYGRKVTAEDLNGTSEWIREKLTAEGWEFGKYVGTSGNLGTNTNYCATFFIPMDMSTRKGHSITFGYMFNAWSAGNLAWYNGSKTFIYGLYYSCNENNARTVTISTSDTWDNAAYIRMTCNPNRLNECYILDNTTGEYIFKGDEYLVSHNNNNITYDILENSIIMQELGDSTTKVVSQNVAKEIQENVDAIGRRAFGTTSAFNANNSSIGILCHSIKKYNVSTQPWVDVVSYNVAVGMGRQGIFFGFCPYETETPQNSQDYVGFKNNIWSADFVVRRGGITVLTVTKAIPDIISSMVVGFRLDFRRKVLEWKKRKYNGALETGQIDLNDYDIDLGYCYLYSSIGYCSEVADQYIGWNSPTNMTDFEAYFNSPLTVGNFKKQQEHTYPSDGIDGSTVFIIPRLMNSFNSTQDSNGHWVASFDSPSSYVNLINTDIYVYGTYLYSNWDLLISVGKLKVVSGTLYLQAYGYYYIKDIYDITDGDYLVDTDGVYIVQEGHTVEIRGQLGINSRVHMFNVKGSCTLEMWDWECNVAMNENLTPTNYDGKVIFGGIPFYFDLPSLVIDKPLVSSSNYYAQGFMKYTNNKLYARVYDTSTGTYVDKQISNT